MSNNIVKKNQLLTPPANEPKYIAQGLLIAWKKDRRLDTSVVRTVPLIQYLEFNYQERYVKLCKRLGVEPCSFSAWLRKPISSVA